MRFICCVYKEIKFCHALIASLPYKQTCLRSIATSQEYTQGLRVFIHSSGRDWYIINNYNILIFKRFRLKTNISVLNPVASFEYLIILKSILMPNLDTLTGKYLFINPY